MNSIKFLFVSIVIMSIISCGEKQDKVDLRLASFIFEDNGRMLSIRNTKTDEIIYAKENTDEDYGTIGYNSGVIRYNEKEGYACLIDNKNKQARYFALIDNDKKIKGPTGFKTVVHQSFFIGNSVGMMGRNSMNSVLCSCIPKSDLINCTSGGEGSNAASLTQGAKTSKVRCSNGFYACCKEQKYTPN